MDWYLGVWKKYATFDGRARRKEYWMFFLVNLIASFILTFGDNLLRIADDTGRGPLNAIYSLAVFLPSLAVGVRRMHDTNHSGWWIIVPLANLVFALSPGDQQPNRFGPDPKAPAGSSAPAGWHADPSGRHQYRYWDGTQWTADVSDSGVAALDPI